MGKYDLWTFRYIPLPAKIIIWRIKKNNLNEDLLVHKLAPTQLYPVYLLYYVCFTSTHLLLRERNVCLFMYLLVYKALFTCSFRASACDIVEWKATGQASPKFAMKALIMYLEHEKWVIPILHFHSAGI